MKKKTINKIISAKFTEWSNTINDEHIKKLVQRDTIITGGCIASLLLQEPINDFDVYFKTKETTKAVAEYYVKCFLAASNHEHSDGKSIEIKVVEQDKDFEKDYGRIKIYIKSAGIAGAKGESDYQYFEQRPPEEGEDFVDSVVSNVSESDEKTVKLIEDKKYFPVFMSANAITLSDKMQIVIRFYGDPDNIHQHYDYIHCTNYWTSTDGLVLKQPALESLMAKELIYVGSKYPLCSVIRTRKFLKRGWTINAGQYLKMCFQISKLDLENLEVLEDQLTGVDAAYFGQLVSLLKDHTEKEKEKGENFKLDYGYLATIIDKLF